MSTWLEYDAVSVGEMARESCERPVTARVLGITSRGVFVQVPPQRLIFLSLERYRSPLTITLDRSSDRLRRLEVGATVQLSDTRLIFPTIECSLSISADKVWHCPPPRSPALSHAAQVSLLQALVQAVLPCANKSGLADLLPKLAGLSDDSTLSAEQVALLPHLLQLRQALQAGDDQTTREVLQSFLGQGRGLTPSGDDLAIGLLLMLNRWSVQHHWTAINQATIDAAYRLTTTISANLIECAANGQGDERLLTLVDGIAAGSASIEECTACVLDWGSSSGLDALIGITLAVT